MKKWLEQKFTNTKKHELNTFIEMLKGADKSEAAMTIALATHLRNSIPRYTDKLLSPTDLVRELPFTIIEIGKVIKSEQRSGNTAAAAGWMVWLHTLRACDDAQLRHLGKQMWHELERGQLYISNNTDYQKVLISMNLDIDGYDLFPEGLHPDG